MAASELTVVVIGDGDVDVRGIRRALTAASIDHDVVVVRLAGRGYGDAFREGAARATGRYLLTVDGDVAADPDVIERMWAARGSNGVVIASRYVDGGSVTVGWSRHIASRLLNAIYRRGLSMHVRDLSSAYRLYRRDAIAPLTLHGRHFDVLEEVLVGINADGWPIAEVPFRYVATGSERSLARPLSLAWAFVRTFGSMWVL